MSDLRESGAIEQDADMVLFVHRPEYYHIYQDEKGNDLHGMAQIIIAKHRKGATRDVLLTFKGEFTSFRNPEDTYGSNAGGSGEIMGSKMNEGDMPPIEGSFPPPMDFYCILSVFGIFTFLCWNNISKYQLTFYFFLETEKILVKYGNITN